jgi:hypothetical protein
MAIIEAADVEERLRAVLTLIHEIGKLVKPGDVVHKALQLPENQEEKGSGIRVLVRRGIEECIVLAEELHEGDVVVAWPAHDEATEKRTLEIEKAIRDGLKELRTEDKPE